MPPVRTSQNARVLLEKYQYQNRRVNTTRSRLTWGQRKTPKTKNTLTPAEKTARRERREASRQNYNEALQDAFEVVSRQCEMLAERFPNHNAQYFLQVLMQYSRKRCTRRKVNPWNAFLRVETQRIQESRILEEAQGVNTEPLSAPAIGQLAKARWNAMTPAERHAATQDSVKELEEIRHTRRLASHNVAINAFHDARSNLASIETQLRELNSRTGVETLLVAVRSTQDSYFRPRVLISSERVENFFQTIFNHTLLDFSVRLEAFMLSGVQGVVVNYVQSLLNLKARVRDVIHQHLQEAARPDVIPRMNFRNFDTQITLKYGIVCENWPLSKFCSPSDLTSRVELELLLNSWQSGTTRFRRLDKAEYDAWERARFETTLAQMTPQPIQPDPATTTIPEPAGSPLPPATATTAEPAGSPPPSEPASIPHNTALPAPSAAPNTGVASPSSAATNTLPSPMTTMITSSNGALVQKKPRKQRSDKGTKRGPRKPAVASPDNA